jgi:hypothetical protein
MDLFLVFASGISDFKDEDAYKDVHFISCNQQGVMVVSLGTKQKSS